MDASNSCWVREDRNARSFGPSLSERGIELTRHANPLLTVVHKLLADLYLPENPNGIINIGVAENSLMHEWLTEYFNSTFKLKYEDFTYGSSMNGSKRLFAALCRLINAHFAPLTEVEPSHLVAGAGASAVIDQMTMMLCNPGEGVMIARPYYNGFDNDITTRVGAKVIGVALPENVDPASPAAINAFEEAYQTSLNQGVKPRAVILCNPHNPLGFCYPRETIAVYLRFVEAYDLHLIVDEIYALSVFEPSADAPGPAGRQPFISALSIDARKEAGCDPARVHVVYGMSKDFCANGLRIGVLVSQHNRKLIDAFDAPVILMKIASTSDLLWAHLLNDKENLSYFLDENRKRLGESYEYVTRWLTKQKIPYRPCWAGHFIWIDMRDFLPTHDKNGSKLATDAEREQALFVKLVEEARIYIAPGVIYHATVAGMFRITFPTRRDYLDKALDRLSKLLDATRESQGAVGGGEPTGEGELRSALAKLSTA